MPAARHADPAPQSLPATRKITPSASVDPLGGPASRPAIVRGRCLDAATGLAVAGCTAGVHGWEANQDRVESHLARFGPVEWKDPESVTTGTDGRFELRFTPPPPYQFLLTLKLAGHADMEARWLGLNAAELVDVGDVAMPKGALVRGRAADAAGVAQSGVQLNLAYDGPRPPGEVRPRQFFNAVTRSDGTYSIPSPVQAARFTLEVRGRCQLVEPKRVEIVEGATERVLDLVVSCGSSQEAAGPGDTITGVVRDDRGNPVHEARVEAGPPGPRRGMPASDRSGRSGTFRLQRRDMDPKAPVAITAVAAGYEPRDVPVQAEWGAKDVVVIVKRGASVQIVVRDGDNDKPLERYGVRCFLPENAKRGSGEDVRLRDRGEHPGGVLELAPVASGRNALIIEPDGPEWTPSVAREFEMTPSGGPRQEITVWRDVKKTVRLRNQDGAPVAKSKVELVRRISEEPLDERTYVFEDMERLWRVHGGGHLVSGGETNDDGMLDLSGPSHEMLFIRALGPGHLPLVRELDFGAAPGVIELSVASGATFSGSIKPLELMSQLGELPERHGRQAFERGSLSGVFLRRRIPGTKNPNLEYPVNHNAAPIEADGSFRISGVPAGKWQVHLRYTDWNYEGTAGNSKSHLLGVVELLDGQERQEIYDLGHLLKAEIEGVVTLDGKPMEELSITLEGEREGPNHEALEIRGGGGTTGSGGKIRLSVWPGQYRLVAWRKQGRVHDSQSFKIAGGEKLSRNFDVRTSKLKVRVVAADGVTPVSGVQLRFQVPKMGWPVYSGATNGDGLVEVEGLPPGCEIPAVVLPKALSANEAQLEWGRKNPGSDLEAELIKVGAVTVTPPESSATIVLPASTGY
jgi:hypothetical protein